MNPFIIINDFVSHTLEEYSAKGLSNFKQNFGQYLNQMILDNSQYIQWKNGKHNPRAHNLEQYMKNVAKNERGLLITIDELVPFFVEECLQSFIPINPCFATYYLHLLIRDAQNGIELNEQPDSLSICDVENFLERALAKFKNPLDATMCNMKISHFCRTSQELCLDFVKEKYEMNFNDKLKQLINSILQYPETSSDKQLEEMYVKMQVFIITNYHLGCPKNPAILKQCRQSLNSVLGKGDIQKYVIRKRYHRLEYLQKLGATVAGILIFNNQGPQGDKEYMRNIFANLKMAKCNTKESLQEGIDRALFLKHRGTKVMQELIEINVQLKNISCFSPLTQVREVNKFVVLFEVYKKNLEKAKAAFEKTLYLMEMAQKKFDCVVEKINDVLKYRSAIESEMIFPHFVYLSEIWTSLMLYLNHLVEINKIKDHLDGLLNEKLENKFNQLLEELCDQRKNLKQPLNHTFQELLKINVERGSKLNLLKMKLFVKDYCAVTMALTGGFLAASKVEKKLCENIDFFFGFANMEYAKFAEHQFKDFIQVFCNTILTSNDLILMFQLDDEVMQQDFDLIHQTNTKSKTLETQTENILSNELQPKNRVTASWNVWDFHRQTINLASIRRRETHSSQSKLCYGIRNAQNQSDEKSNKAA